MHLASRCLSCLVSDYSDNLLGWYIQIEGLVCEINIGPVPSSEGHIAVVLQYTAVLISLPQKPECQYRSMESFKWISQVLRRHANNSSSRNTRGERVKAARASGYILQLRLLKDTACVCSYRCTQAPSKGIP